MRKVFIALASCAALVAAMAFSAPAFAIHAVDPSCDLDHPEWGDGIPGPYDNTFVVRDLSIQTTDSSVEHEISGVTGHGLACGTDLPGGSPYAGFETFNNNARLTVAPGVAINSTSQLDEGDPAKGRYVGSGTINAAGYVTAGGRGPLVATNQQFDLRVDSIGDEFTQGTCAFENARLVPGPAPGEIVACYRGDTIHGGGIPGHNWNWVSQIGGTYYLTIGPFYNDLYDPPERAGITDIRDFTLCAYVGVMGPHKNPTAEQEGCGDGTVSSEWLQKNGDASTDDVPIWGSSLSQTVPCSQGDGRYTVIVTRESGEVTDSVSTCVSWIPSLRISRKGGPAPDPRR